MKETDKLSALATKMGFIVVKVGLKETDKLSALATSGSIKFRNSLLKETDKLSALATVYGNPIGPVGGD